MLRTGLWREWPPVSTMSDSHLVTEARMTLDEIMTLT